MCRHESLLLSHLVISTVLGNRYCDYCHFRGEEIKAKRNEKNVWMITGKISNGEPPFEPRKAGQLGPRAEVCSKFSVDYGGF